MGLEAKNLEFRYGHSSRWILKDVSALVCQSGENGLAWWAPVGYGKSTLAKILAGYEVLQPLERFCWTEAPKSPRKASAPFG